MSDFMNDGTALPDRAGSTWEGCIPDVDAVEGWVFCVECGWETEAVCFLVCCESVGGRRGVSCWNVCSQVLRWSMHPMRLMLSKLPPPILNNEPYSNSIFS